MSHEGRVLGIVACHLLEDELVHVLGNDSEVQHIYIVDAHISDTLESKLRRVRPDKELEMVPLEDIDSLRVEPQGSVIIWQKPVVLHLQPHELHDEVLSTLRRLEPLCSGLLIFYGLCGNAFLNYDSLAKEFRVPICILRDHTDQVVDDCIGVASGGCEEYLNLLRSYSGTFYLTPMWASNWRQFFRDIRVLEDEDNLDGAKYVFEFMGYRRVLKLNTGLGDDGTFDKKVSEFSEIFSFTKVDMPCSTDVVDRSYQRIRHLITEQDGHHS